MSIDAVSMLVAAIEGNGGTVLRDPRRADADWTSLAPHQELHTNPDTVALVPAADVNKCAELGALLMHPLVRLKAGAIATEMFGSLGPLFGLQFRYAHFYSATDPAKRDRLMDAGFDLVPVDLGDIATINLCAYRVRDFLEIVASTGKAIEEKTGVRVEEVAELAVLVSQIEKWTDFINPGVLEICEACDECDCPDGQCDECDECPCMDAIAAKSGTASLGGLLGSNLAGVILERWMDLSREQCPTCWAGYEDSGLCDALLDRDTLNAFANTMARIARDRGITETQAGNLSSARMRNLVGEVVAQVRRGSF